MESFDQGLWNWFQARRTPWLDPLARDVSILGTGSVLAGVVFLAVLLLFWKRKRMSALVVASTFGISLLLVGPVQGLIGRERPEVAYRPLEMPEGMYSFPSKHALLATATYLAVFLAVADLLPGARARALLIAVAALLALAIGVSRLSVGLCYPSDVAAGWLAGLCLALAGRWIKENGRWRFRAER